MKQFIKNILSFGVLLVILYIGLIACVCQKMKNTPSYMNGLENVIVMGNSHPECAINDSLISNWYNIARSGEQLPVTYTKLVYLLKYNPQIDTLLLAISPFYFNKDASDDMFENGSKGLLRHWYLLGSSEWILLLSHKFDYGYFKINRILSLLSARTVSCNIFGGYQYLVRNKLEENIKIEEEKRKRRGREEEEKETDINPLNDYNIVYLNKIKNLCKQNKIQLLFIQLPHYDYRKYFDFERFYKTYNNYFSDIRLLDYVDTNLPDACWGDLHHLNHIGAKKFTTQLKNDFYGVKK